MKINHLIIIYSTLLISACTSNISNTADFASTFNVTPSNLQLNIKNAVNLNSKAFALSTMCSAHTYNVNVGEDLTQAIKMLDVDNSISEADADIVITGVSGSSKFRCVVVSPVSGKCQSDVNITGDIKDSNGRTKAFDITKKSIAPTTACGGVTQSLKTASSEAISDLLNQIKAF